jgi:hypothetical protein
MQRMEEGDMDAKFRKGVNGVLGTARKRHYTGQHQANAVFLGSANQLGLET